MYCFSRYLDLSYSGKVWQAECLANLLFSSIWRKKVWRMNRLAKGLSMVTTNLDGLSLVKRRRFAKFAKLSPRQNFPAIRYIITPDIFIIKIWYHETSSNKWFSCSKLLELIINFEWQSIYSLKWLSSVNWVLNISLNSCRICLSICWEKSIEYRDSKKILASDCNVVFEQYCTYIHTHIHTYIHAYIHTYIHTCIHIYTPTHTHTYIHK